jgi:hypothetical protein
MRLLLPPHSEVAVIRQRSFWDGLMFGFRTGRMKIAIYARVSTQDQTCESQLRELREYAARRGWIIACEYVNTGWSGAKASRPQLDRLMRDAAAQRKFDCVLVWKIAVSAGACCTSTSS